MKNANLIGQPQVDAPMLLLADEVRRIEHIAYRVPQLQLASQDSPRTARRDGNAIPFGSHCVKQSEGCCSRTTGESRSCSTNCS
jgi:hypothetical protein